MFSMYEHFYQAFPFIVEAHKVIWYRHHLDKHDVHSSNWDAMVYSEIEKDAASITLFVFIVTFLSVIVKLQKTTIDNVATQNGG